MKLSIIIPCYNEQDNIANTVQSVLDACKACQIDDFEIIPINDGSTDGTAKVLCALSLHSHIFPISGPTNYGFGKTVKLGLSLAKGDYVITIPGDNEVSYDTLVAILGNLGKAGIIIPYIINPEIRHWMRRFLSRAFTMTLNIISGNRIKYYNGCCLYWRSSMPVIETSGFAFNAIMLAKLLRRGYSYIEVPMILNIKPNYKTSAFKFKNVVSVVYAVLKLAFEIRIMGKI